MTKEDENHKEEVSAAKLEANKENCEEKQSAINNDKQSKKHKKTKSYQVVNDKSE